MDSGAYRTVTLDAIGNRSIGALVYSSWIKAEKSANDRAWASWRSSHVGDPPVSNGILCEGLHNRIERLLARGASVRGVVLAADPDVVLGFAVAESGVLHWISVKEGFRRHGLALGMLRDLGLLESSGLRISARTATWASFAKHCGIKAVFDPYAVE